MKKSRIPIPGKPRRSKLSVLQEKFIAELNTAFEEEQERIQQNWNEKKMNFLKNKSEYDESLDNLLQQAISQQEETSYKLAEINQENEELANRLEVLKLEKAQILTKGERKVIEKRSEVDLELNLQTKSVELNQKLNELQRNIDHETEEMRVYKKNYKRALEQYGKLREMIENEQIKKDVKRRKIELLKKQKEIEQKKAEEAKRRKDPLNKYKALLDAAGQARDDGDKRPQRVFAIDDGPLSPDVEEDDGIIVQDYVDHDQEDSLEARIKLLIASGNYTEDDPVIRGLRKELAALKK